MMASRSSLCIVALLALTLFAAVSATDTYMTVYAGQKKFSIKVSLANFGYFKYGHRLNGRVQFSSKFADWGDSVTKDRVKIGSNDKNKVTPIYEQSLPNDGCSQEFQQFNEEYRSAYGSPVYFVNRGNCTFSRKARNAAKGGKMLIIGDNSNQTDVSKIIMSDDFIGDKVMIPVVMISNQDATLLSDYLEQEQRSETVQYDLQVWVTITFQKPHEGKVAALQYWMIPAEKQSYKFFFNHQKFLESLSDANKLTFQPHFVFFRCDEECKRASYLGQDDIKKFCLFDGQFCNLDPDGKGPLSGADAVIQSVKELCIYTIFPEYFLSYFFHFHQCYVVKSGQLQDCDYESKKFVVAQYPTAESEQNFKYRVQECERENTITSSALLEKEYDLQKQWGIKFFPSLFLNGDIFRGDLKMQEATEEFICQGIENSNSLTQCQEYSKIEDDKEIDERFTHQNQNESHSNTILIVCIILLIFFIVGLFVYRRKIRMEVNKELALQVDSAIQQYYTLNDTK